MCCFGCFKVLRVVSGFYQCCLRVFLIFYSFCFEKCVFRGFKCFFFVLRVFMFCSRLFQFIIFGLVLSGVFFCFSIFVFEVFFEALGCFGRCF